MGEPLDVLGQALGVERLDGVDDPGVERAPAILEQAPVGHLVGERMLEGVLEIREEARLVQELGRLEVGEPAAEGSPRACSAMAWRRANGTSLPMTEAAWSRRLSSGASRSMRAARIACAVAGICDGVCGAFASR